MPKGNEITLGYVHDWHRVERRNASIEKLNSDWMGSRAEVTLAKKHPEVTRTNIAAALDSHPTVTYNNNALPMRRIGQR